MKMDPDIYLDGSDQKKRHIMAHVTKKKIPRYFQQAIKLASDAPRCQSDPSRHPQTPSNTQISKEEGRASDAAGMLRVAMSPHRIHRRAWSLSDRQAAELGKDTMRLLAAGPGWAGCEGRAVMSGHMGKWEGRETWELGYKEWRMGGE